MRKIIRNIFRGTRFISYYRELRNDRRFYRRRFINTKWGYKLCGIPDMQLGRFEFAEGELMQKYLKSAEVFIDIGANVGYYTCLALSMGKYVVAVEPVSDNLRYLYANIQENGWTDGYEIIPVGLSEKPGLAVLYGGGTGASLIQDWAGISPYFRRTISTTSLDNLIGNRFIGKRMIIKMDIEGAEYDALKGAENILQISPRPNWLVEITLTEHRMGKQNSNFMNTFDLFWKYGYHSSTVGKESKTISRKDVEEYFQENGDNKWESYNYWFY